MFPQEIRKEVADRLADLRAMEEWRELHAKIHKEGWHPRVHYVVPSPDTLIELSMSTVKSYEIALVRYYEELERDPATTWERPEPPNVLAREFDPMKYVKEIEKFGNKKKKKVARVAVDK